MYVGENDLMKDTLTVLISHNNKNDHVFKLNDRHSNNNILYYSITVLYLITILYTKNTKTVKLY